MGEFSRLTGVFFDPKTTFADIARRPAWIVPAVLLIVAALAASMTIGERVGWPRMAQQLVDANPQFQRMEPEQREKMLDAYTKGTPIMAYSMSMLTPAFFAIIAGVLLLTSAMFSAGLRFKQVFAVVCYAKLTGLISAVLLIVVLYLKNPEEFNVNNPLAFNPGAFMDPTTSSKFLYSLASSLDLFTFWTMLLIAIGLKAAAGKKLSFGSAVIAVVLPWAVVVLGYSAWAGLAA
jgi:hypothetical protein